MEKTMKMICHERARREEFEMFSTSFKDYEKGATWSPNERARQVFTCRFILEIAVNVLLQTLHEYCLTPSCILT